MGRKPNNTHRLITIYSEDCLMFCISNKVLNVTQFFFPAIGEYYEGKLCDILKEGKPINVRTVNIKSSYSISRGTSTDSGLLLNMHGQCSQQQSGQSTLQSVLTNKPIFLKAACHAEKKGKNNTDVYVGGNLEMVTLAHDLASSRPKPCVSLKIPHKSCLFATPYRPSQEENVPWPKISSSLRYLPVRAFDSRAKRFSTTLAYRRPSCPSRSPNLVRPHPIDQVSVTAPLTTHVLPPFRGHHIGARKRRNWSTPSSTNHTAAVSQSAD